jgi:hypothetical protein
MKLTAGAAGACLAASCGAVGVGRSSWVGSVPTNESGQRRRRPDKERCDAHTWDKAGRKLRRKKTVILA